MKVVYNWLKDFVDATAPPEELASRLALAGTNIGSLENGPHGAVIDAEIGSNRPDCLGHYGIAREVAAIYKLPLKHVSPKPAESAAKSSDAIKVEIQAPELCGRFTARVIRNVKIQPSPKWLKDRLEASGVSSISNVVDVSNYVMLELGHALHAFDYDKVRDHKIVVRPAKPKEKVRTLDGVERQLDPGMCMISDGDGSRSIGIGGIMGGAETEISFSTKNVLIECAWFDPVAVRRASRSLKLHTEASLRFGRGADPEMAELASRRSAELILELAGGELLAGVVDVYPGKRAPEKIRVTRAEILRVMGADVPDKQIEASLSALGFAPVRVDHNRGAEGSLLAAWECAQPSWRAEVEREIDLIEEIARIYGLDKFPPRLPAARQGAARLPQGEAETRLRQRLIGLGYREIVTIPHVAEERDALFRPAGVSPARLSNPLSEEAGVLKSTGIVTMAAALEWNLNHGQRDARLFEIGRHYRLKENRPVETSVLTIGATGEAREKSLYESPRDYSFADLKGALDEIGQLADGRDAQGFQWRDEGPEWLHPGKRGKIQLGNVELGMAGQLTRRIADLLKLRQGVFLAEIELAPLYSAMQSAKTAQRYVPLPRFPSVQRDFSLLLAEGISFAQISQSIRSLNIQEITSIEAVDLFRGKNVPAGKYSLLVRVTFQSREATLTDAQINHFEDKIISILKHRQGAQLRAS
ncbi:MAG: phenylalanine--tRNA ligase subunit beta [Acidobacteria bacterium]|nr:MAG: phenylalanine--tRNA ligase subunit beta [Acidobacteria bacterium 13_2_20CM_58_27]PYT76312.1 MAG: phenylalanine--tRNA ligase subunit beta [Acidobacteriota bacterium]PYT87994.1 MAG: phenylalanine--tRNA ligase subunit beta [Acidobacteriota bacterium]